jgi:hypothetical protein
MFEFVRALPIYLAGLMLRPWGRACEMCGDWKARSGSTVCAQCADLVLEVPEHRVGSDYAMSTIAPSMSPRASKVRSGH